MIAHRPELLDVNIGLWKQKNVPDLKVVESPWEFCLTGKKAQLNLRQPQTDWYLYSTRNIEVEVRQWFGLMNPHRTDWIIVYGVGLGYYYQALVDWLHADPHRGVLFIEDDPGVLKAFFETDCASDLLQDPQADLIFIKESEVILPNLNLWMEKILFRKLQISALASYDDKKNTRAKQLRFFIELFREINQGTVAEYLLKGKAFFQNFFPNVLQLDQCLDGSLGAEIFKGIPAIICGAGPSLAKNIEVLKTLKDRAVIFAGGTAMNALNAYDLIPHFGCGVDPFFTHFSRIIANTAFETPYFIRNRMNKEALAALHGPRLYLPGASGYPVSSLIDAQLGYEPFALDEGANVINTSLAIAKFLGCNPIICVGVDLGYTDGLAYPPGITAHGIHDPREQFVTKGPGEELIMVIDINGKPIYSLMKWVIESLWYSSFAETFPELKILNCTEGGIGFQDIQNLPLSEAADLYLKEQSDIDGHIHYFLSLIAQKASPTVSAEKKVLAELADSLFGLSQLLLDIKKQAPDIWTQELPSDSDQLREIEKNLHTEKAYAQILKPLDDLYCQYMRSGVSQESPSLIQPFLKGRFPYLLEIVKNNIKYIQKALKVKKRNEEALRKTTKIPPPIQVSPFRCVLKGNEFSIEDPSLKLSLKEKVDPSPYNPKTQSGFKQIFDKENRLMSSAYYLEGVLHGPSTFYFPSGKVCSSSWYVHGRKEGLVEMFGESGELLVQKTFKAGLEEGVHLYFYSKDQLKSSIPFSQGLLDGEVSLYYPNGAIMRRMHFKRGKKEGEDHLYSMDGQILLQAEYSDDKPINSAKMWYQDGTMAKEVVYRDPGIIAEIKRWDIEGNVIPESKSLDYFDKVAKDTLHLGDLIQNMFHSMSTIAKNYKGEASVKEDVEQLTSEMETFKKLQQELLQASGLEGASDREAIWKTPAHALWIKDFLYMASSPMQESLIKLQWKLKQLKSSLPRKPPNDPTK